MIATGTENRLAKQKDSEDDSSSDLDLEGIDDDEIDRMILKPAEVQRWVTPYQTQ